MKMIGFHMQFVDSIDPEFVVILEVLGQMSSVKCCGWVPLCVSFGSATRNFG